MSCDHNNKSKQKETTAVETKGMAGRKELTGEKKPKSEEMIRLYTYPDLLQALTIPLPCLPRRHLENDQ